KGRFRRALVQEAPPPLPRAHSPLAALGLLRHRELPRRRPDRGAGRAAERVPGRSGHLAGSYGTILCPTAATNVPVVASRCGEGADVCPDSPLSGLLALLRCLQISRGIPLTPPWGQRAMNLPLVETRLPLPRFLQAEPVGQCNL